jgi:hypothetical protein
MSPLSSKSLACRSRLEMEPVRGRLAHASPGGEEGGSPRPTPHVSMDAGCGWRSMTEEQEGRTCVIGVSHLSEEEKGKTHPDRR